MNTLSTLIFNFIFSIPLCMYPQTNDSGNRILENLQNEDCNFYVMLNNKGTEIGKAHYEVERTAENRIKLKTRTERITVKSNMTNIVETTWLFDEKGNPESCIRFHFIKNAKGRLLNPLRELISFSDGKIHYESEYGRMKLVGSLDLGNGYFPFFGDSLDTWVLAAAVWHREMGSRNGSLISQVNKTFEERPFRILLIHSEKYNLHENSYDCTVYSLDFKTGLASTKTVQSQGPGSHPILDSRAASEGYERIQYREWRKQKQDNPFFQDAETRWTILKDTILNSQEGRPSITAELYVANGQLIAIHDSIFGRIVLKEPDVKTKATYEFVK